MSEPIQEHYSKKENCIRELGEARKVMTDVNSTPQQWEAMDRALALMFLYCPEDMQYMVQATLDESTRRQAYIATKILREELARI